MRCLDSTFLIDLLKGDAAATAKMKELEALSEPVSMAAPSLTELLLGAHFKGGALLRDTLDLVARVDILDVDAEVAAEAGRLGAELLRRGQDLPTTDLLIGAAARLRGQVLVTRDTDFARIPGLAVEGY
ncbi:MAG: type II toxin-antitoxin system VapC family toxin [Thermoplasmata archaeon]